MRTTNEFVVNFAIFYNKCVVTYTEYMKNKYPYDEVKEFTLRSNEHYILIFLDDQIKYFVKPNGDIIKAASWNTPSEYICGNIFDNNFKFL